MTERRKEYQREYYRRNPDKFRRYRKKYKARINDYQYNKKGRITPDVRSSDLSEIETVFKAVEPFEKIKNGHGYLGIILRDPKTDTLQCHVCGRWFKFLGNHVRSHGFKVVDYKIKYGLPLQYGLVSRELSNKRSIVAMELCKSGKIKGYIKNTFRFKKKMEKLSHYGSRCAAHENKYGFCKEQIDRRYLMVSDMVGRNPTQSDIIKYDSKLLWGLKHRYGSLNKFRKEMGYDLIKSNFQRKIMSDKLLSCLRKFYKDQNRLPMRRDFVHASPSYSTIRNRFGSWRKALSLAGII